MISKNLFFNLMKENIKRRIWVLALGMLVFFFAFPVVMMMRVQVLAEMLKNHNLAASNFKLDLLIGKNNIAVILITIVAAVICAVNGFSYLHDKKKVDFYHSIPVKRETLFLSSYLNGILIYAVTYLINLLFALLVLGISGFLSVSLIKTGVCAFFIHLLGFLLVYHTALLAVMLTGHMIVALLATGVLCFYGALLPILLIGYFLAFYHTFYNINGLEKIPFYFSPIVAYSNIASSGSKNTAFVLGYCIFLILLMFAVVLLLYKKRKSEAAGKAMAFEISKPIVKFFLTVLCSLGGGLFFMQFSYNEGDLWFLFGLWMGLFLSHIFIEVIYEFDIKAVFRHKRQVLFAAAAVCIIAGIFRFDLLSYDSFLPKEEKIADAALSLDLDEQIIYGDIHPDRYRLKTMKMKDTESILELAQAGIEYLEKQKEDTENVRRITAKIKYHMKNGNEVYRSYQIPVDSNFKLLNQIYQNPEYKAGVFPIYGEEGNTYQEVIWSNYEGSRKLSLKQEKLQELIEIYKKELLYMDLYEVQDETPLGVLDFSGSFDKGVVGQTYCVYPSFQETIAFLKSYGISADSILDHKENITAVTIENNLRLSSAYGEETAFEEKMVFTDQKDIEEILQFIMLTDYIWNQRSLIPIEHGLNVQVEYKNSSNLNSSSYSYSVCIDKIPEEWKGKLGLEE